MPQFTVQLQINVIDGCGINRVNVEDVVMNALTTHPTLKDRMLSVSTKQVVSGRTREPLVTDHADSIPYGMSVTINDIVRAVRSGANDSLRYALEAFYRQCKNEPAAPVVVRMENKDPEITNESKIRSRLYNAVFPLMNKRFKEPHTVPSRFFNTWNSPISVFLDPAVDVSDSTGTCEDVWEFVRAAIAQEFNLTITESHPLYRYTPGWTLGTIAKLLSE